MRRIGTMFALAVLGLGLSAITSRADEKKIPLSEVPKPVTDAFKAKFPKATIKNAIKEEEGGKVTYEIESTLKSGMSLDAVLKPDGEFVAIETEIKVSDIPAVVAAGVKEKYPTASTTKAEEVNAAGKITYEITIKKDTGKAAVVVFSKDGKFIEEE
jgi:hypothetical protein